MGESRMWSSFMSMLWTDAKCGRVDPEATFPTVTRQLNLFKGKRFSTQYAEGRM
jgi:hypothetical protein